MKYFAILSTFVMSTLLTATPHPTKFRCYYSNNPTGYELKLELNPTNLTYKMVWSNVAVERINEQIGHYTYYTRKDETGIRQHFGFPSGAGHLGGLLIYPDGTISAGAKDCEKID